MVPARILARLVSQPGPLDTPCLVWQGHTVNGYASAKWEGRERKLHKVIYEDVVGPVPDGLVLDHLCRNRACCAVDHTWRPSPSARTSSAASALAPQEAARTHCPAGHEYAVHGFTIPSRPNARYCRPCKREHARAYRAREAAS